MATPSVLDQYRLGDDRPATLDEARAFCRDLTSHYENFTVVSWLVPRPLRQHFANIYAYCRISDDLADEVADQGRSLQLLDDWRQQLDDCYAGSARHPVFVALTDTIAQFDIPRDPFTNLLDAFCQDRHKTRFADIDEVLAYCRNSADPVGRLVLYLGGFRDEERQSLSDQTCTALQLANFWQDVARDWDKGRVYLPQDDMLRFGVTETQLAERRCDDNYRNLLRFQVERTRGLFRAGLPLLDLLTGRLRRQIMLFSAGGWSVLDLIEAADFDTLSQRPELPGRAKARLLLTAMVGGRMPWE